MSEAIAELLHSLMCDKGHTEIGEEDNEKCTWFIESFYSLSEWEEQDHLEYLAMAENEMKINGMRESDVIDVMNLITKIDFTKSLTRKILKRFIEIAERS